MVSLIYVSDYTNTVEHLGTASIKSFLDKKGISTNLHTLYKNENLNSFVSALPKSSRFFGLPLFHTNAKRAYNLISNIKKQYPESIIFVGGPFATLAYKEILDDCLDIDFIVLGDGEETIYNIIRCFNKNLPIDLLPSVASRKNKKKKPGIINIEKISWPSRVYLEKSILEGNRNAKIYAARGCCGNCSFCSFNIYYRKSNVKCWYGRNINDVFDEIIYINKSYGIRDFTFVDGSFEDPGSLGKERISQLCDLIINYPIKMTFWCWLRAESFRENDIELIKKMKKAGFVVVYIGFESNNEQDLKIYNKRNTINDNKRAIKLFSENGIDIEYGFIMINPYSTRETLKNNFLFLESQKISQTSLYTNRCQVYYKTDIFYKLQNDGLLGDSYSYLDPLNIKYVDSFTNQLIYFLELNYYNSSILDHETNYLDFKKLFIRLKHMVPKVASIYCDSFYDLDNSISKIISEYFSIIYIENDLVKAQNYFSDFSQSLTRFYTQGMILRMKLLKHNEIRDFLRL